MPLAIADANSVVDTDKVHSSPSPLFHPSPFPFLYQLPLLSRSQVPSDLITNKYPTGETFRVHFNPSHRWLYLAHMTPKEYILIKCFDSTRPDKIVPHTAFVNEDAKEGAPKRQSIEVRCLVLYDE